MIKVKKVVSAEVNYVIESDNEDDDDSIGFDIEDGRYVTLFRKIDSVEKFHFLFVAEDINTALTKLAAITKTLEEEVENAKGSK